MCRRTGPLGGGDGPARPRGRGDRLDRRSRRSLRASAAQQQSRVQTIAHIAVHDALNAILPRYARYTDVGRADPHASPDAAVAAAGRETMLALLAHVPDSPLKQAAIATIEAAYTATVGPGPYDAATQAGIDAGAAAAEAIVALRAGDGSATPHLPYTLRPGPGVYQPTPNPEFPAVITPSFAGWAHVTPFALARTVSSRSARRHLRPDERAVCPRIQRGEGSATRSRAAPCPTPRRATSRGSGPVAARTGT